MHACMYVCMYVCAYIVLIVIKWKSQGSNQVPRVPGLRRLIPCAISGTVRGFVLIQRNERTRCGHGVAGCGRGFFPCENDIKWEAVHHFIWVYMGFIWKIMKMSRLFPMDPAGSFLRKWDWGMIWGFKYLHRRCLDPYIYIYSYSSWWLGIVMLSTWKLNALVAVWSRWCNEIYLGNSWSIHFYPILRSH